MSVPRSLLFYAAFYSWTILLGFAASPALLYAPLARRVPHLWVAVSLWLLEHLCGLRIEVRGEQHRQAGAAIYAAKHQSALDTLALWRILGGPVFILKRELLRIPIFGWYLWRTGPIAINRGARAQALAAIATQGQKRAAEGRSFVIFPEGTRTRPGTTTHYKIGGLSTLYTTLQVPVVPIALNTGCFWGRNALRKRPGVAIIEFLPPLPAGLPPQTMVNQLKTQIEDASAALL